MKEKTITCTTSSKLTKFQQASHAWSLTQTFNLTLQKNLFPDTLRKRWQWWWWRWRHWWRERRKPLVLCVVNGWFPWRKSDSTLLFLWGYHHSLKLSGIPTFTLIVSLTYNMDGTRYSCISLGGEVRPGPSYPDPFEDKNRWFSYLV